MFRLFSPTDPQLIISAHLSNKQMLHVNADCSSSANCQTQKSEETASAPLLSVASAPIASVVKTVAAQISVAHPNWEVNERRLTKFVKKELAAASSSSAAAMTDTTNNTAKGGKKIKFTSPIARLKKKKKAKEEMLASAIKEAAPNGGGGAGGDPAVSPVKMADLATPAKEGAGDGPYKDDNEAEAEPICASCVIC